MFRQDKPLIAQNFGFSKAIHRSFQLGTAAFSLLSQCTPQAKAGIVTIPPASREASICAALQTEAPCETEEIGHVRAVIVFLVQEADSVSDLTLGATMTIKNKIHATRLGTFNVTSEAEVLEKVNDPNTNWDNLILDSRTWKTIREIAGVSEGVPVIVAASPKKGGIDGTQDLQMASTAGLKVRISLLKLR